MKDPEKEMAFITSYEKLIVGNKIRLDTSRDKHKWSCNTYHCLVELIGSKVKCHCPQCEIVRHQINIQLRLVFTWTNQFHHENNQCEDAVWKMCEGIFSLITQSHPNFTKNSCNEVDAFDCTSKLLNKGKGKEANTEGPGSEGIPAHAPDA